MKEEENMKTDIPKRNIQLQIGNPCPDSCFHIAKGWGNTKWINTGKFSDIDTFVDFLCDLNALDEKYTIGINENTEALLLEHFPESFQ